MWSIGKDAEHVAEAAIYHQWIVRLTIGQKVSSRRPLIERHQMTPDLAPVEAAALLRQRTEDSARLLLDLTDEQLDLPTKPPRAKAQALAQTIGRVLIGHYARTGQPSGQSFVSPSPSPTTTAWSCRWSLTFSE